MIYKHILLILAVVFTLQAKSQEQDLSKYLKEAGENNPELRATYHEYYAALEKVPQVGALPDPKLSFGYFISPVETRLGPQQMKFSVSQMFPWFGTLKKQEEAYAEKAKVKYQQFLGVKNKVYKKVKLKWYELYKVKEEIRITKENLDVLYSLKQITERNYETGKTEMTDVLRLDVNIREQENKLEDLREQLSTTKTEFNLLLNKNKTAELNPPQKMSPDTFDLSYYRDSVSNNPDLKALEHKVTSLKYQQEVAKKKGYPNISLALDYAVIGKRQDMQVANSGQDIIMPMVGISIPLYRKKYNAMEKEKALQLKAVKSKQQSKANNLSSEYKKAEEQYLDAMR